MIGVLNEINDRLELAGVLVDVTKQDGELGIVIATCDSSGFVSLDELREIIEEAELNERIRNIG